MNTPRAFRVFSAFVLGLGAVIAFAGEPAAANAPAASHAAVRFAFPEKIPCIVITAKRLTAEQKKNMGQEDGNRDRNMANKKSSQKGA